MIHIIIAVLTVTPHTIEINQRIEIVPNLSKFGVTAEIRGIGLFYPNERGIRYVRLRFDYADFF